MTSSLDLFDPSYEAPWLSRRDMVRMPGGYERFDPSTGAPWQDNLPTDLDAFDSIYGSPRRREMNVLDIMGGYEERLHFLTRLYIRASQPEAKTEKGIFIVEVNDGASIWDEVYEVEIPVIQLHDARTAKRLRLEIVECREKLHELEKRINNSLSETAGKEYDLESARSSLLSKSFTAYDYMTAKHAAWQSAKRIRPETPDVLTSYV